MRWDLLEENTGDWREQGAWISPTVWFGFDITHSWAVGTERVLLALAEDPEWIVDMFARSWKRSWRCWIWPGMPVTPLMRSCGMTTWATSRTSSFPCACTAACLKPFHQKAIEWAHAKGITGPPALLRGYSPVCARVGRYGPGCVEPARGKGGHGPGALKHQYGDQLVLHGGVNAVLWDQPDAIQAEMERVIPAMKENGGYIFSSDHSVPSSVSLEDFRRITDLAKRLGSYS